MQPEKNEKTYKCGPGFGSRGERAYALRVEGKSWDDIAEILKPPSLDVEGGNPASAVSNAAKKYARTRGLEWPVKVAKAEPEVEPEAAVEKEPTNLERARAQQKLAYELRASKLPWAEVVEKTDYAQVPHAVAGAGKYAARTGLPWPITLE